MKKIVALVLSLVMVLGLATTAFGVSMTAYAVGADGSWVVSNGLTTAIDPTADEFADLAADKDHYLPGYYVIGGNYFVEVAEAAATNKVVYGAKTIYLSYIGDGSAQYYVEEAKALAVVDADDAVCGEYNVANLDDEDVYYASFNKDGSLKNAYVAAKNGAKQILVAGKLVKVDDATVAFAGHSYVGYDVVNYEYTTVKCAVCGKVAPLFKNATAAGKGAVGVAGGWITKADMFTYGVSAPAAGETVESAKTFDAGIAMYVGMSVMAAAGSAVVLKKKD